LRAGDAFTVRFLEGNCHFEPGDSGVVDCTISADPVAFLLVRSGRMTQWEAIALGLYSTKGPGRNWASPSWTCSPIRNSQRSLTGRRRRT
jgi:hypothetical protein